ncbi:hypothetical protein D3880_04800 [Pseudomonas cavernae]|uniref:Uncharacterized protein n=1 Tax=Pseudomonas cavernae TaxID=2320867 RepID=A0A385Z1J7_9PSED|nr:hypothetical protein [Pseudomonas cavernae]AYC31743.1 hypothetical protein D3880_04800 [Pseudomonas cavernae]
MSLQVLWSLLQAHPAQSINSLALFFAIAGSWLLLATRLRERRALARLAADSELQALEEASLLDERTLRINRFFSAFGWLCLALALLVSAVSTQL